jgi:hypothetical protein
MQQDNKKGGKRNGSGRKKQAALKRGLFCVMILTNKTPPSWIGGVFIWQRFAGI